MKRIIILCGLGALLTILPLPMLGDGIAHAEIIEIPFPEFTGTYDETNFGNYTTSLPFIYDPAEIISVSVRLSGSTMAGIANCLGEPGPWPIELLASIGHYYMDEFWTASPGLFLEDGSFDLVMVFDNYPTRPDTWNLLDDGNGEISFFVAPAMLLGICSGVVEPTVQIDEFVVVIDLALVVPVEKTTWDGIKAQYR